MRTIGIYEKALPSNVGWEEKITIAKKLGFDFIEMSIDESDERLQRLEWTVDERLAFNELLNKMQFPITSICLSGHRRYPLGSKDKAKRIKAIEILKKTVDLAVDIGVRTIQLAGYDVYYEEKSLLSREYYLENLMTCVQYASTKQVMLSIEIMDDPFINSIQKFKIIKDQIKSPWLQVYPDIGNLSAWPENDVGHELELGKEFITAVHIKDTIPVSKEFPGKFKSVNWGEGSVDFLGALKTLSRINYQGCFVIEMWSENDANPEESIVKAIEFLNPFFKEAGYGSIGTY